jgi:tRNA/rRNA methyltransferase
VNGGTPNGSEGSSGALAPAVVLVRPQEEGNVGAVARAMANFGLERLLVVEPAAPLRATAYAFAAHAQGILDRAERHPDLRSALAGFGRIVATTAARARPWPQALTTPRELPPKLAEDPLGTRVALLFGPEPSGLTNEELALASLLVRVPTAPEQPTLNLSQAVLLVAYELFLARATVASGESSDTRTPTDARASGEELAGFFDQLAALLRRVRFARDATIVGVERDLRRLLARAAPTRREIAILRGVLRRLGHALGAPDGRAPGGGRRRSG